MLRGHALSALRSACALSRRAPLLLARTLRAPPLTARSFATTRAGLDGDAAEHYDLGMEQSETLFDDDEDMHADDGAEGVMLKDPVIDEFGRSYGTGRRKTSVARVWIKAGSGEFMVNHKEFVDYFQPLQRMHALEVFQASRTAGHFDVWCTVKGGGMSGQAGAVRLGISRALEAFNPSLRPVLSRAGMLTRDSRRVERKKPGQKKARKKFQWVKR